MTNAARVHRYQVHTLWQGNTGQGTADYRAYRRDHEISGPGKMAPIPGSSDPIFRGDPARYNPEELLVGALSACHMLWVLHLSADSGITITDYSDQPLGLVTEHADGSGEFTEVTLRPVMKIKEALKIPDAEALHRRAHEVCALARSVNFAVRCEPTVTANG